MGYFIAVTLLTAAKIQKSTEKTIFFIEKHVFPHISFLLLK